MLGKTNTSEFGTVPFAESQAERDRPEPLEHRRTRPAVPAAVRPPDWLPAWPPSRTVRMEAGRSGSRRPAVGSSGSSRRAAACRPGRGLGEHWHGFSTQGPIGRTVEGRGGAARRARGPRARTTRAGRRGPSGPSRRRWAAIRASCGSASRLTNPNEIEVDPACVDGNGECSQAPRVARPRGRGSRARLGGPVAGPDLHPADPDRDRGSRLPSQGSARATQPLPHRERARDHERSTHPGADQRPRVTRER